MNEKLFSIQAKLAAAMAELNGLIINAPVAPVVEGVNYTDPKYNNPDMTDRQMMTHIMTWVHPNGLPSGWSWKEWATATGRKYEPATGFYLNKGEERVNNLPAGTHVFQFVGPAKIEWKAPVAVDTWVGRGGLHPLPSTFQRAASGFVLHQESGPYNFYVRTGEAVRVEVKAS